VTELKSLSEQLAKLKASVDDARLAVEAIQRATPVTPPATPPPAALSQPPPPMLPPAAPRARRSRTHATLRNPDRIACSGGPRQARAGKMARPPSSSRSRHAIPNHPQAAAAQNWSARPSTGSATTAGGRGVQKTVDNYTQTTQVAEALLKIGLCKRAMGDAAGARAPGAGDQAYPRSEAATQARGFLAGRTNGGSRVR